MTHTIRKFFVTALIISTVFTAAFTVNAALPTDSYTYWEDVGTSRKSVYNKPMYTAEFALSSSEIGVSGFEELRYVCTDTDDNVYLLDSQSRIIILDSDFELVREIGLIGGKEAYKKASSIYVHTDGTIYICDTDGGRIIHSSADGDLIEIITLPESPLIPDDFIYAPKQLQIDKDGYIYIISDGSYYGALLYSPEREFLGFYGANDVKTSVATVLKNISNRLFPNNEKKSNVASVLPYCFVGITMDSEGFIYTCNGYTSTSDRTGQIRKLSPGKGKNILESSSVNFTDTKISTTKYKGFFRQNICDIAVDESGLIYGLESIHGKIFVYDRLCRIITVFAGGMLEGTQIGSFSGANSIALKNNARQILVSDGITGRITVFTLNDYGGRVKSLIALSLNGNYKQAKDGWLRIIEEDANFQPAYSSVANAYISEGNYLLAMEYAKKGYDREAYAVAFEYVRRDFINRNFILIFALIFIIAAAVMAFMIVTSKRRITVIKNRELRLMLTTPIHPSNSFLEIKEKGRGSLLLSAILAVSFYVATVLQTLAGGFMFTVYDTDTFNSIWVLARTLGFVVLWVLSNWLICSLTGGRGKLKEITVVTCYSLIPLIIERFIYILLTHILLPSEADFLGIFDAVAVIYFIILLLVGLSAVHDFEFGKLIGTCVLSLIGMAVIIFLFILVFILAQQFYGFIVTLLSELLTF